MVIKFDHISYSCDMESPDTKAVEGYCLDFEEKQLPNIKAKHDFLQNKSMLLLLPTWKV